MRVLPQIRFPEFAHDPAWECLPLRNLAQRVTLRNTEGKSLRPLTNSAEYGVVDQREFFDKDIATTTDNYFVVEPGDYVYNSRKSATAPVGPISKNAAGTGVMSPLYTVFRFRSDANDYFAQYFKSSRWHQYLRRISNSGARHDRMAITNDDFMGMPVPSPSAKEQQKIADCLGSLDDLIAAADRKLAALRQHKQGLMQQLFPQPGETVPRLRFPEFREKHEWKRTSLAEAFKTITNGKANSQDHQDSGEYPLFDRSEVVKRSPTFLFDAETVILPGEGMSFQPRYFKGKFNLHQRAYALMDAKIIPFFAFYALDRFKNDLAKNAVYSTVRSLRLPIIEKFKIPCPEIKAEQQKIADCFGSLDDLIAAADRNLESLKAHKKGLLQQLFPNPDTR